MKLWNLAFVALMLALTGLFVVLGFWQVARLTEKELLIAAVTQGMTAPPIDLPPAVEWQAAATSYRDPATGSPALFGTTYRHVMVTGTYLPEDTVLVFTSLADANGAFSGPGYWVMTPLALASGGSLFVNLGFIPQDRAADFRAGGPLPVGVVSLTGLGKPSEAVGSFTPVADVAKRVDWVRNADRLAALAPTLPQPVLPIYVDLPAGEPGALPQGGETTVEFPNNHLGYAMTWFGFALITPILLVFWVIRQRRPKVPLP